MQRAPQKKKKKTNWSREIKKATGLVGQVFLRILSYLMNILLTLLLVGLITGAVVGCTVIYYINNYIDADISAFDYVTTSKSTISTIYYMDWEDKENRIGTPVELEDQQIYGSDYQMSVPYKEMPPYLWQAFVAIEDKRFFDHNGVDFVTTGKAIFKYAFSNGTAGGSTITQQLVKMITGDNSRTIQRKIQEWLRAFKVEEKYDKTEILEMYLNTVPLSHGCKGVQAAAYTYFGKDVSELTLVECAAIASITNKPTQYDPILNPDENAKRRKQVLYEMYDLKMISREEYDEAKDQPIVINYKGENNPETGEQIKDTSGIRSWYTDAAYEEAKQLLVEKLQIPEATASQLIYSQGYKIITAMDPEIQSILEEYFENDANFPRVNNSAIQPECSMVIIDPLTGDVAGLVGGRGEKKANNILNYATATTRSPGSSIKPISVYAPALEEGLITYGTAIDDTPVNFGEEVYEEGQFMGYSDTNGYPDNYDKKNRGRVTVNTAIMQSYNTISVKVLQMLGVDTSFDYVKNKLHIDSFIDVLQRVDGTTLTDRDISALALGGMNYGVTVKEMTAAYQIFANKGVYNKPRIVLQILDSDGNVIIDNERESEIVISEQTASIMTRMLQNVATGGTAARGITCDSIVNVAGKTGTTTQDNDRWFLGYTPYYVGGVWFGYAYPQSLSSFSSSVSPAVKVWDDIMTIIHQKVLAEGQESGYGTKSFVNADGVVTATYCKDSGMLITDACKADPRGNRAEVGYFTTTTVPTQPCNCHVLVDYDIVTGGIAVDGCPADYIKKVGLLHITDRQFPYNIVIEDAQYVWYGELEAGVSPALGEDQPYYANMLPVGMYAGISGGEGTKQFNRACSAHVYEDYPGPGYYIDPFTGEIIYNDGIFF